MRAPTFSTLLLSSSLAILVSLPGCVKAENVPVADFCTTITTEEACNEYMSSESVVGMFCTWYDQKCVASVPCQNFDDDKALCIGHGGFYFGSMWTQWCYYNDITKHCMDFTNYCENIVPVTDGSTPNALDETACNAVRGCSYTSSDLANGERQFSCKQFNQCPWSAAPFDPAVSAGEEVEAVSSQDECESLPNCAYDESLSICYNPGPDLDGCNAIASRDECSAEGCVWTEISQTCGDDFNCAALSLDPPGCTQAGCEVNDLELNGIDLALCQIGPDGSPNVTDPLCPESFAGRENGAEFSSKIENVCLGTKPIQGFENFECIVNNVVLAAEQAGANVTAGHQGLLETDAVPQKEPFWKVGMCAVNVHVHSGTEHYSRGQFDEAGNGPTPSSYAYEKDNIEGRKLLASNVRTGYQCHYYNSSDPKFTTEFDWQFCSNFEVGQTYEVHWPHSAAGACGTPDQMQFPFYDGVFCFASVLSDTAAQIGVQAQVFTLVNDESFYYNDLFNGMIVDDTYGQEMAYYTGSTTGTTRNNEICSAYAPITWQVDTECHMISASSFDKMCADMIAAKDDMGADTFPHGSRILVEDRLAANNLVNEKRSEIGGV